MPATHDVQKLRRTMCKNLSARDAAEKEAAAASHHMVGTYNSCNYSNQGVSKIGESATLFNA